MFKLTELIVCNVGVVQRTAVFQEHMFKSSKVVGIFPYTSNLSTLCAALPIIRVMVY